MAVFRVEKNKGYTVMSNHHLRNKELSLKAKGLLSQMLSLPEDWDYTLAGLSLINRESIDAIRTAVWELEKAGYTPIGLGTALTAAWNGAPALCHGATIKPEKANPALQAANGRAFPGFSQGDNGARGAMRISHRATLSFSTGI